MLKNLLNKTIIVCTLLTLFTAQYSFAQVDIPVTNESNVQELTTDIKKDVKVNDLDVEPLNTNKLKKEVMPDTKKEFQTVMQYFLRAMLCVVLVSVLLVVIGTFVQKFRLSAFVSRDENEDGEISNLCSPETKEEALKSFINRTR